MNKLSYSLLAATGLAMFACSSDDPVANVNNGYADGKVTFAVSAPAGFGSRAVADGLSATELNYAVFDAEGNFLFQEDAAASFTSKVTTVQIPLVIGKEYKVAFFAKAPEAPYTITDGVVAMNYNEDKANDDAYDAFYKMESVTVSADMAQQEVTLKRPFAQVNIGATDWQIAKKAGYVVESTGLSFTAEVYTSFNLVDGTAAEAAEVTFALATLPDYASDTPATLTVEEKAYDYMAMAYVLPAAGDKSLVNTVTFSYQGPDKQYDVEVNAVPVQPNHRTNILGRFFTTDVDYKIVIDEEFDQPDNNKEYGKEIIDGAVVTKDKAGNIVCITPSLPEEFDATSLEGKGGVAVDAEGNEVIFEATADGLKNAMASAKDIYFAPNAVIPYKSHAAVIPATGINIHGNGARLEGQECDFALQYTQFAEGSTVDINIYNLNNARIWGDPGVACTYNVTMTNCAFIGGGYGDSKYSLGLIMMRGNGNATHNITLDNCYVEGVQVGMHSTSGGEFNLNNCTFKNSGIPLNLAKKSTASANVNISGCKFIGCGLDENGQDSAWNYAAPIRVVDNAGEANSMKVNITNCQITDRKGSYDVLLTDYREGKTCFPVSYEITGSGDLTVKTNN